MGSLSDSDTLILFAQASAGLGHLRVTDALYHGLPPGATSLLLHSQDKTLVAMHNIMSTHFLLRDVMEFTQGGWAEHVFTSLYRPFLRSHTKMLRQQFATILEERQKPPKTVLVVATHFGLAHQVAALKKEFEAQYHIQVVLVVVVTDDSPQKMWAVDGADLTVVPSEQTKRSLEAYQRSQTMTQEPNYAVLPYMVSPLFAHTLPKEKHALRKAQLAQAGNQPIHIAVPISGAAVQLSYLQELIEEAALLNPRFFFHIVAKKSLATNMFLTWVMGKSYVDVRVSEHEREVIDLYEQLYAREVIALEITKPSEQAFKALVKPSQVGGSILLFSDPVGRQEWDNLSFLGRHHLMPRHAEKRLHWEFTNPQLQLSAEYLEDATRWRALRLPADSHEAAQFLHWALTQGVLAHMSLFTEYSKHPELSPDGVQLFWQVVGQML